MTEPISTPLQILSSIQSPVSLPEPFARGIRISLLAAFMVCTVSGGGVLRAASTPAPSSGRPARTNVVAVPPAPGARTNPVARKPLTAGSKTNAVSTPQPAWKRISSQALDSLRHLRSSKAYYPVVIGLPVCVVLALIFLVRSIREKAGQAPAGAATQAPSLVSRPVKKAAKVHVCTVLETSPEARHVWLFDAQNGGFVLDREQTSLAGEPLPAKLVSKNWSSLFKRKLNVAWLPPEQVFLRVAQFPRSDFTETLSMVELQLEKLSPIPTTQIVWSIQVLPHNEGNLQTVIVMIVARNVVEEFLGQLEGQGYLADRLELPLIDQLQATPIQADGAWIYPQTRDGKNTALVAWWYGGVLQNLDLVTLPSVPNSVSVREQLLQMAWAGEMEGWLKSPPVWHLVADTDTAAQWEPALREALEQPLTLTPPLPAPELAALTARRAAHADPRATLLPLEFSTRYQQQFVDRLWMRSLLAVAALYLIGVAIYAVALGFATFSTRAVEKQIAGLGNSYTNTVQLREKFKVLKDRHDLKFAALQCWNEVARLLPDSTTLENLNFTEGRRLSLDGTAPSDQRKQVIDFEESLRKATTPEGELMFAPDKGEHLNYQVSGQGGSTIRWRFSLELKRGEVLLP